MKKRYVFVTAMLMFSTIGAALVSWAPKQEVKEPPNLRIVFECTENTKVEITGTLKKGPYWFEIEVVNNNFFLTTEKFLIGNGVTVEGEGYKVSFNQPYVISLRQGQSWSSGKLIFKETNEYHFKAYRAPIIEGFPKLNSENLLFEKKFWVPKCEE